MCALTSRTISCSLLLVPWFDVLTKTDPIMNLFVETFLIKEIRADKTDAKLATLYSQAANEMIKNEN